MVLICGPIFLSRDSLKSANFFESGCFLGSLESLEVSGRSHRKFPLGTDDAGAQKCISRALSLQGSSVSSWEAHAAKAVQRLACVCVSVCVCVCVCMCACDEVGAGVLTDGWTWGVCVCF